MGRGLGSDTDKRCIWCATSVPSKEYPYRLEDKWAEAYLAGDAGRIMRGGAWEFGECFMRGADRSDVAPFYQGFGLRVASDAPLTGFEP